MGKSGVKWLIGLFMLLAGGKAILFDTLDPDCFWHLRVATELLQSGIGPIVDHLSFESIRQPWTPYSWAAELAMKAVWDTGGYQAAVLAQAVMQAAIVGLLALACRTLATKAHGAAVGNLPQRRGLSDLSTALVVFTGLFLTLPYLSFRPVTLGFVILFGCTALFRRGGRSAWWAVPLTILYANVHLFVFFIPAIAWVYRTSWKLLISLAVASTMTPMLPGLLRTAVFYSSSDSMVSGPVIAEMRSFARGPFGTVSAVFAAGLLAVLVRRRHEVTPRQWIGVIVSAALMLKLGRFAPVFAIVVCPIAAPLMPRLNDRLLYKPAVRFAMASVFFLGVIRIVASFPSRSTPMSTWLNRHGDGAPGYPCAAADFVVESIPRSTGRVINEFSWGGYLEWRLGDRYQTLLDGRTQVFPPSLWRGTYLGTADDRQTFLSGISADAAVVPTGHSVLKPTLESLGWRTVYRDGRAEVLSPPSGTKYAVTDMVSTKD